MTQPKPLQRAPVPIVWTVADPVSPWPTTKADLHEQFWTVDGGDGDPHDTRHLPDRLAALRFLVQHKLRMGDTIRMAGPDTGNVLHISTAMHGQQLFFDVGTHEVSTPEELIRYLDGMLQPGDTVTYLHN